MRHPAARAVVVGGDARPGGLEALLGSDRHIRLRKLLLRRALAWARAAAPGGVLLASEPESVAAQPPAQADAADGSLLLTAGGPRDRLRQICDRVFAAGSGPVLIVWSELGHWTEGHAEAALGDLREGCALALGPLFDGRPYLLALDRPQPVLWSLTDEQWRRTDAWVALIAAVHEGGSTLGLLRAERGLRRPEDATAALADPLTDPELRALLAIRS